MEYGKTLNALTIFINTKHTGELMQRRGLFEYIKQTPFLYFFLAWLGSILIIGVLYWIFSLLGPGINLNGELLEFSILAIFKNVYASILAATLFGAGLLTTSGIYTILVYLQIAITIVFLLILLDKIVQRWIAPYHHNLYAQDKKITTIMLMMSIFRNDVDRILHALRNKSRTHITTKEIEAIIDGLYVAFLDAEKLFSAKNPKRGELKNIQYLMITENIQDSLEKLEHFLNTLQHHHVGWKDKSVEFWLQYILETSDRITHTVEEHKIDSPKIIVALNHIREHAQKIREKI